MSAFKDLMELAGKHKAKILTRLRIDEVSSVDRGAGDGVKITLMKRDDDLQPYWLREFSSKERESAAESGAALPDGSFPIKNKSDLHNAMQAIGRAKNPAKAKAHIKARARALGLSGELSDAFKRQDMSTNFFANIFGKPNNAHEGLRKATAALAESVASIEPGDPKRDELLAKTFQQFQTHILNNLSVEKADDRNGHEGDNIMSAAVLKALGLKDGASEEEILKAIAARDEVIAKAKADLDEEEEKEDEKENDEEKKKAFRAMTHPQRKEYLRKKYSTDLPPALQEILKRAEEDRKEIQKLKDERELQAFAKIALDAGMSDSEAATLQKAHQGDKEAVAKLVGFVKAANTQAKAAGAWKEIGSAGGDKTGANAVDQLKALAAEYRKTHPELSQEQAFAKIYSDPANRELAKRERFENAPRV